MAYFTGKNPYAADAVNTVSPPRLLVMVYDRLALDLERAELAAQRRDPAATHEALVHAQDILHELHVTLDTDVWPAGAQLAMLYQYMTELLVSANVRKDAAPIMECRSLLAPIHDAWKQAASLGASST